MLIVDKKSDLNIYKERTDAGDKGCGEPAAGSSSCCGTKIPITENDDVANIDFNEWVGECPHVPCCSCAIRLTWM